jgi:hypothetical protein
MQYDGDTLSEIVAFSPTQIKSATNNNGNYDPNDPNIYHQRTNGYYDPELEAIVLGRSTNSGTLPHEFAHFWLEKVFNLTHNNNLINDRVVAEFGPLFEMLGVSDEQTQLTMEQHEQFATMTEAYIFGLAPLPKGTEYAFTEFQRFVPPKYQSLLNIGYRDSNGKIVNPLLDKAAVDWFNSWYGNLNMYPLGLSPASVEYSNMENQNGEIAPSTEQVIKDQYSKKCGYNKQNITNFYRLFNIAYIFFRQGFFLIIVWHEPQTGHSNVHSQRNKRMNKSKHNCQNVHCYGKPFTPAFTENLYQQHIRIMSLEQNAL